MNNQNQDSSEDGKNIKTKKLEGGWAWIIVCTTFLTLMISGGCRSSFGVFYDEILNHYKYSRSTTALVNSVMMGTYSFSGIISGPLIRRYGTRTIGIAAAVLTAAGFSISAVAPNIYMLYFTIGICSGTGFGFTLVVVYTCVLSHFNKRRALALGITACGSGVGTSVMSYLEKYSWRSALLIVSGLLLSTAIFAISFRPPEDNTCEEGKTKNVDSWVLIKELFKDAKYRLLVLLNILAITGYFIPEIFIVTRVNKLQIAEGTNTSFFLLLIGISEIIGKITSGYFVSRLETPKHRLWYFNCDLILCGLTTCLSCYAKSYNLMASYCGIYGALAGTYTSVVSIIMVDIVGLEKYSIAYGISFAVESISAFLSPPITGWLCDYFDSYDPGFLYAGCFYALDGLLLFLLPCIGNKRLVNIEAKHEGLKTEIVTCSACFKQLNKF